MQIRIGRYQSHGTCIGTSITWHHQVACDLISWHLIKPRYKVSTEESGKMSMEVFNFICNASLMTLFEIIRFSKRS